jgi:hypothetical protein
LHQDFKISTIPIFLLSFFWGLAHNFRQKWVQNKTGVSISESQEEVKVPILHFELGASTSHFRFDGQLDGLHEESMRRVKKKYLLHGC